MDYDTCMEKYTRIWEQVTERFADYGDHLILESMNEEEIRGFWKTTWTSCKAGFWITACR